MDGAPPVARGGAGRVGPSRRPRDVADGDGAPPARPCVRAVRVGGDRGALSRPGPAVLVGRVSGFPQRQAPPRARAEDAAARARDPRGAGRVREPPGRCRESARGLLRPPPALPQREGALHGRPDGGLLPTRHDGARRARRRPAVVPRHGVRAYRVLRHDRVGRHGRHLQLGVPSRSRDPVPRRGPARAPDPRRDRAREAALRLPPGRGAVQVRVRARRRGRLRGEDRVSGGGALRVAMLSVHTCPLAALGGKETGGMNVYVRELSRELGRMGVEVDVFTRSQNASIPRVVPLGERARVVHLAAGPQAPMPRAAIHAYLDEFVDGVDSWRLTQGADYDLIHAHYWLSGVAALALRERWSVPVLQMFHTLGRLKNRAARSVTELEPALRLREETRIVGPLPQDVLPTYYVAADVTVLPSYYESFGMVALEAMACGSPVIASRVGGLVTTVRDGVTGFLVPESDVGALAERIAALIADPDLRWRIGAEGVRWAAAHRWPCVAEAICREYASLEPNATLHLASARSRD